MPKYCYTKLNKRNKKNKWLAINLTTKATQTIKITQNLIYKVTTIP